MATKNEFRTACIKRGLYKTTVDALCRILGDRWQEGLNTLARKMLESLGAEVKNRRSNGTKFMTLSTEGR